MVLICFQFSNPGKVDKKNLQMSQLIFSTNKLKNIHIELTSKKIIIVFSAVVSIGLVLLK